ncbi:N-acetylmuramic acid 6-phosphate etherase [Clostridium guangxiense]|uniref:N-acetylmuramic acid 6-phosphate etherase n=1 Tax=Clostridium guangxiense TaxID=1662055 RepID=UPI001E36048C|nr:N-acetylmuramic acid 6-phosphate etherase [Clostridium guangxiense]MCD2345688.1 N-acetylmuramic acid 6-phosphate etherase [Clostridium guangxiense]
MNSYLESLITEQVNSSTKNIDTMSTIEILNSINNEDIKVAYAVKKEIPSIVKAVDIVSEKLKNNGRLFYIGAGTSGRLGILDASECPATYSTDPEIVQGIIAGGSNAVFTSIEGAEDDEDKGKSIIKERGINSKDVVIGITASGRTPFVIGAMKAAKRNGITTIGISNNKNSMINEEVDIKINPIVGPEVIMGSTRMKAGTSQKLILNMITTASMVKLGKVYGNLMIDLQLTNKKLLDRAVRIIEYAANVKSEKAKEYLEKSDFNPKIAIVMLKTGEEKDKSKELLQKENGFVTKAIEAYFK